MPVVEDRHGAFALLKDIDHLLVEPPTRVVFLPNQVVVIDAVLAHQDNAIDGQIAAPKREGLFDGFEDGHAFGLADVLPERAFVHLVDVAGGDIDARWGMGALPPVAVHELGDDPIGMGTGSGSIGDDAGEAWAFPGLRRGGGGGGQRGEGLEYLAAGEG